MAGLTLKDKAELSALVALTEQRNADAEKTKIETEDLKRTLERAKFNDNYDDTRDFFNGFFRFDSEVDEATIANWVHTLRRFERIYPQRPITIELCSGGGSIIDGFAFFDEILRLRKAGHHVTIRVRGNAASMAAVILQAADVRQCGPNAFIMLHRAAFGAIGSAYEVEDTLDFVKKLEKRIIGIFINRTGKPVEDIEKFFSQRKDIWFDAEEALAAGLIDEVV